MPQNTIFLVGFGSQASAWAQCLRKSGWTVQIFLHRQGTGYKRAVELGFQPQSIEELPAQLQKSSFSQEDRKWIAMLCPDTEIAPIYRHYLAALDMELRLILAHGFCLYTGELKLQKPTHQAALLAPKSIGPQLLENFEIHFPNPHPLAAAFFAHSADTSQLVEIAKGLGFQASLLIPATFQQETVGDLISEQGLLCGGLFNLLEWTMEIMAEAGVPDALIREECLTELELVAKLIRKSGPADAFRAISQAAQCGTIATANTFEKAKLKDAFQKQMQNVLQGDFSEFFQSPEWRSQAKDLAQRLSNWQNRLRREPLQQGMRQGKGVLNQ